VLALIEEIDKLDVLNKWKWFKFKVKQIAIDTFFISEEKT